MECERAGHELFPHAGAKGNSIPVCRPTEPDGNQRVAGPADAACSLQRTALPVSLDERDSQHLGRSRLRQIQADEQRCVVADLHGVGDNRHIPVSQRSVVAE